MSADNELKRLERWMVLQCVIWPSLLIFVALAVDYFTVPKQLLRFGIAMVAFLGGLMAYVLERRRKRLLRRIDEEQLTHRHKSPMSCDEIRRLNRWFVLAVVVGFSLVATVCLVVDYFGLSRRVLRYGVVATFILAGSAGAALGVWRQRIERSTGHRFRFPYGWD